MRWILALALGAGCGRVELDPTPGDLVDDGLDGEFGAGTFLGTRWSGDRLELAPGAASGDFVSRVFDSGVDGAVWGALRWDPGAPYGKPLPDGGAAESGYRAGSFDMRGNVLLAHFDETIADASPAAVPLQATALGGFVPGPFGAALADTQQAYVRATVSGPGSVFNFGTDSITWSLWVRTTRACPGNAVYMGIENPGTGLRPHLWLGCTPIANGPQGSVGNTWCSVRTNANDCARAEGTAPVTTGQWRHMAIVKEGHAPATLSSYLDGALQATVQASYLHPIVFDTGVEFAIGAFSQGTYPAEADLDEAAVWRRALSREEVVALYRRGAHRLELQVRACDEPTCAAVPFAGPGGDPDRSFVDPANAAGPPAGVPVAATGRYLQYRVRLESREPGGSPALHGVRIAAAPVQ